MYDQHVDASPTYEIGQVYPEADLFDPCVGDSYSLAVDEDRLRFEFVLGGLQADASAKWLNAPVSFGLAGQESALFLLLRHGALSSNWLALAYHEGLTEEAVASRNYLPDRDASDGVLAEIVLIDRASSIVVASRMTTLSPSICDHINYVMTSSWVEGAASGETRKVDSVCQKWTSPSALARDMLYFERAGLPFGLDRVCDDMIIPPMDPSYPCAMVFS